MDSLEYPLKSIIERIQLSDLFPTDQPLEIELGAGDGSFLIDFASRQRDHNFIGVERLLGRLRKIDRKAKRAGLTNVRCIQIESSYFLKYLLPHHCARALHLYFPDPWPKRKHRRHRLVNEQFPTLAHQVLTSDGIVYLRTDDEDYFQQMLSVFGGSDLFQPTETPAQLASVVTDFERGFQAQGIKTLRAAFQARQK